MRLPQVAAARSRTKLSLVMVVAILWLLAGASGSMAADLLVSVVGVEEDWELVVSGPDLESGAPQVTSVLSPLANLQGLYAAFELNHLSQPSYVAGGMQLQLWNGEQALSSKKHKEGEMLAHANEVICWTQCMRLNDGTLSFEVKNGSSTTWGEFGGPLHANVATSLTNLNGYNPVLSVQNSGPGFAANRVDSLVLKRVRVETSNGLIVEDTTPKTAFPKQ